MINQDSNKGIIYLIQPAELINCNRYKIGCSKSPTLDRCKKGYKIGSRYLCIFECEDPIALEKIIKEQFKLKFKLIAGFEYFEGDENLMINLFVEIFLKSRINNIKTPICKSLLDRCHSEKQEQAKRTVVNCVSCNDTGKAYWSDGIYGKCLECSFVCEDEKNISIPIYNFGKALWYPYFFNVRRMSLHNVIFIQLFHIMRNIFDAEIALIILNFIIMDFRFEFKHLSLKNSLDMLCSVCSSGLFVRLELESRRNILVEEKYDKPLLYLTCDTCKICKECKEFKFGICNGIVQLPHNGLCRKCLNNKPESIKPESIKPESIKRYYMISDYQEKNFHNGNYIS